MDRLIARFVQYNGDELENVDVFSTGLKKTKIEDNDLQTISIKYPTAKWFERKINDDFGIHIRGAYDNRPLLHHERFPNINPMKKDFIEKTIKRDHFKAYNYETVKGEGVFNISVGPIHAGIIEPGHFHFSQEGEQILHLEVRHFYTYRGIEKMCENKSLNEIDKIVARISGNESVAYQHAFELIKYQASNTKIDENARKQSAVLLELERLVHHLGDIGFIPNDAGFAPALAIGSKLSEEAKRLLNDISGSRFGFDCVGKNLKLHEQKDKIKVFLSYLEKEVNWFRQWIFDVPSVCDRLDTTGILKPEEAFKYGCVGVVARGSGINKDVRYGDEFYENHGYIMQLGKTNDVASRYRLRFDEIKNSIVIIERMLSSLSTFNEKIFEKFKDGEYHSFVESSIGELFMYVKLNEGKIDRFYVRDPSFINWQAVHLMMANDIIADFPLINKSCDLSYAGNDL